MTLLAQTSLRSGQNTYANAAITPHRTASERKQDHLRRALSALKKVQGHEKLWPHQTQTLERLQEHFSKNRDHPNAIAVIPTAGGKTEIFGRIVVSHGKTRRDDDKPAIVLVPTRNLITQTLKRLRSLGLKNVQRGWSDRTPKKPAAVVMSYSAFAIKVHALTITPDDIDLIVLDEAHCGLSELRKPALSRFEGQCPIIAFSATPAYDLIKSVYDLLGRENEVIEVTPAELREAGIIAPAINYVFGVSIDGQLPANPKHTVALMRQAAREALYEFFTSHVEPELDLRLSDKFFIGYHATCDDAEIFTDMFNSASNLGELPSRTITGLDPSDQQDFMITALRNGEIKGLNNACLLVEGSDIPTVGAILNFTPTQSLVREVQRCGRAMRLDPRYAPRDHRQLSVVVDVFWEINGEIVGRPRFYFEAINDNTIARFVKANARTVASLQKGLVQGLKSKGGQTGGSSGPGITPGLPAADLLKAAQSAHNRGYTVSHDLRDIQFLINRREGISGSPHYDNWLDRSAIVEMFDDVETDRADAVFDAFEAELTALVPGMVHTVGLHNIRAGFKLQRGNPGAVYAPTQRKAFAALLDHTRSHQRPDWLTRDQIVGFEKPDDRVRQFFDSLEAACLQQRRQTLAVQQTLGPGTIAPGIHFDLVLTQDGKRLVFARAQRDRIRILCGLIKPGILRTPDWITIDTVIASMPLQEAEKTRRRIHVLMSGYDQNSPDTGIITVVDLGHTIRLARTSEPTLGENVSPAIHRDDIATFLSRKTRTRGPSTEWLNKKEALAACGISRYSANYKDFWDRIAAYGTSAEPSTPTGAKIRVELRPSRRNIWIKHIHRDDVHLIRSFLVDENPVTSSLESWLSIEKLRAQAEPSGLVPPLVRELKRLKNLIAEPNSEQTLDLSGHQIRVIRRVNTKFDLVYIHASDAEGFLSHISQLEHSYRYHPGWYTQNQVRHIFDNKINTRLTRIFCDIRSDVAGGNVPIIGEEFVEYKTFEVRGKEPSLLVSFRTVQAIARYLNKPVPVEPAEKNHKPKIRIKTDPDWIYPVEILRNLPPELDNLKSARDLNRLTNQIKNSVHEPGTIFQLPLKAETITVRKRLGNTRGGPSHAFARNELGALLAYLGAGMRVDRRTLIRKERWVLLSRAWYGLGENSPGSKAGQKVMQKLIVALQNESETEFPIAGRDYQIRSGITKQGSVRPFIRKSDLDELKIYFLSLHTHSDS